MKRELIDRALPLLGAGAGLEPGIDFAFPLQLACDRAGAVLVLRRGQQARLDQRCALHISIRHLLERALHPLDQLAQMRRLVVELRAVVIANRERF